MIRYRDRDRVVSKLGAVRALSRRSRVQPGFFEMSFNTMAQALVQLNAPAHIRGRVVSTWPGSACGPSAASIVCVLGAAGSFSVADILMADVLRLVDRFDGLAGHPACRDYVARATARPSFVKAHADQMAHFAAAD
jgi:hypothetical protein